MFCGLLYVYYLLHVYAIMLSVFRTEFRIFFYVHCYHYTIHVWLPMIFLMYSLRWVNNSRISVTYLFILILVEMTESVVGIIGGILAIIGTLIMAYKKSR